jgi:hypothetical protein
VNKSAGDKKVCPSFASSTTPAAFATTASDAVTSLRATDQANGELLSVPRFAFVGIASDACILSEPLPTEPQDTHGMIYRRSLQA